MKTTKAKTETTTNGHKCPECGETFNRPQILGRHRRYHHGIMGSSSEALRRQAKEQHGDELHPHKCPECGMVYKKATGLGRHRQAAHGVAGSSSTVKLLRKQQKAEISRSQIAKTSKANGRVNGAHFNQQEARTASGDPFDIPVAIAFGRFRELCTSMAVEHDLPPRMFAARFAELVYRSTLR